jgi:hypothetical protein
MESDENRYRGRTIVILSRSLAKNPYQTREASREP